MKKISDSYKEILQIVLYTSAAVFIIGLTGFVIVTPLWFAATRYREVFTLLFFILMAALFIFYFISCIKKDKSFLASFRKKTITVTLFILSSVFVLCSFLLFRHGFVLHASLIIAAIFIFSGLIRYYYRHE